MAVVALSSPEARCGRGGGAGGSQGAGSGRRGGPIQGVWWGAWSYKTPHDDTAPVAPKNRLSARRLVFWVGFCTLCWSAFGQFVFAPWFVDASNINADPGLVKLGWMVFALLLLIAWALVRAAGAVGPPRQALSRSLWAPSGVWWGAWSYKTPHHMNHPGFGGGSVP